MEIPSLAGAIGLHAPIPAPQHKPAEPRKIQQSEAAGGQHELNEAEQRQLRQLQQADREVKNHENAHQAAAGAYARGKSLDYQTGPDGRRYAVGGEVKIDTAPVADNPKATLSKAQTIRSAALAPANPSAQDRAVAAEAAQMQAQARAEISAHDRRLSAYEDSAGKNHGQGVDLLA